MTSTADFATIASLSGDPARAAMLFALMDGRALTAGELAQAAGVTPQTASGHLRQLQTAGLLSVTAQGRHRYYALGGPEVAHMIEAITEVASLSLPKGKALFTGPRERDLRFARTCYDHMAGDLGVGLADALIETGAIEMTEGAALLTPRGLAVLAKAGVGTERLEARMGRKSGRVLCRACLDWSARRAHIAGLVGTVLFAHSLEEGWVRRRTGTRALEVTAKGHIAFRERFGVRLDAIEGPPGPGSRSAKSIK